MNINDKKAQIIEKTWQDNKFKKAFIANPKETLKTEFGITVPDNVKVTVLEETDEQLYFVIPSKPPVRRPDKGFWIRPKKELPEERRY